MDNPKLSKFVMPLLGPSQASLIQIYPSSHVYAPPHGTGSFIISPVKRNKISKLRFEKDTCHSNMFVEVTSVIIIARIVHFPREKFQANDRVDDDDKKDKKGNMKQRHHSTQN